MQSTETTARALLVTDVQYHVPAYQRPYEWDQSRWDRLWRDVLDTTAKIEANQPVGYHHFFGAIVLEQMPYDHVNRYSVIDGQQRLTTVLLLVKAIKDTDAIAQESGIQDTLDRILYNQYVAQDNFQRRTRLYPSARDRSDFFGIMAMSGFSFPQFGSMRLAYSHLGSLFNQWLAGLPAEQRAARTAAIIHNLLDRFQLTRSQLNNYDECYAIFESLNSVAMPIRDSDKLRNYCFKQMASLPEAVAENFYNTRWSPMEAAVTPAAEADKMPEHLDRLMWYWCQMRANDQFGKERIYEEVVSLCNAQTLEIQNSIERATAVREIFDDLAGYAEAYRATQWPEEGLSQIGQIAVRERLLNLTGPIGLRSSAHPFLLSLMRQYLKAGQPDNASLLNCLNTIESYLVRRIMCNVATNQHNRIFAQLAHQVYLRRNGSLADIAAYIRGYLRDRPQGGIDRWPLDNEFQAGFVNRDIFRQGAKRNFVFAILKAIERARAGAQINSFTNYEVEHIMPQELTEEWQAYLGNDWENLHRQWLNTLGNLTLLEGGLQGVAGQGLPEHKWPVYASPESLSVITREVTGYPTGQWTAANIQHRAQQLFEAAIQIWPRPNE